MKPRPVSNAGRHCYFVGIRVEATAPLTSAVERTPFVGLQLGQMLGKGAYGRVYKGYHRGNLVAVKVCCRLLASDAESQSASMLCAASAARTDSECEVGCNLKGSVMPPYVTRMCQRRLQRAGEASAEMLHAYAGVQ